MPAEISFGAWSIALLLPAGQALLVAAALFLRRDLASAHRWIALLLIVLAGMLTQYGIGYAGFYDRWRGLSYAPLAVPLAVGPLLYAHIHHLTEGRAIAWWHWIAPISQFGFQAVMFVQSMATKALVFENFHRPFLAPLEDGALFLLLLAYVILCARLFRRYRQWIIPRRANIAPLVRLRSPLAALLGFFLLWSSLALFERLVRSLDYFDEFPAYVALAILTLWIAFEAWRHADHSFPVMATRDTTDWVARGRAWHAQLAASEWWRDSALDANALARNLGTNTTHLSRAFNEGLGKSLPQILNEVRCEAVKAELLSRDGQDYLTLALDAGFGSKASFNRAFKAHTGQTPSQWQSARLKN